MTRNGKFKFLKPFSFFGPSIAKQRMVFFVTINGEMTNSYTRLELHLVYFHWRLEQSVMVH